MAQIIVIYDPRSRVTVRKEHLPHDLVQAVISLPAAPKTPAAIKKLATELAEMLMAQIAAK